MINSFGTGNTSLLSIWFPRRFNALMFLGQRFPRSEAAATERALSKCTSRLGFLAP